MTDCRPKVCGWVGVQICLLVACRVPFHTLGWRHQLDLSTLSEIGLCRCCTWWLDPCCQFPENNLLSQHQLELFEDLDKTLLSKISTECLATSDDQFRNHTSCYQKSSLRITLIDSRKFPWHWVFTLPPPKAPLDSFPPSHLSPLIAPYFLQLPPDQGKNIFMCSPGELLFTWALWVYGL